MECRIGGVRRASHRTGKKKGREPSRPIHHAAD
jgi:hypothetical protein